MEMDKDLDAYISIGQFAEQAQLSIKALRLYQTKGLLTPAYVDPFTSYRYYTADQIQAARLIRLLRQMDMPMAMIKQVLEQWQTDPKAADTLVHKYLQLFNARVNLIHHTAEKVLKSFMSEESLMLEEREVCLYDLPVVESQRLLDVLTSVLDAAQDVLSSDRYRLVGTTASILHGAATASKGVDFLMRDRDGVDDLHLALSTFRIDTPPTYLADDEQYWASYFVDGVHVGVTTTEWKPEGSVIEASGEGPWQHFSIIPHGQHQVPTVKLELRLVTEIFRNRADRIEPLMAFMRQQGCDLNLVKQGLTERGIPAQHQTKVMAQLTSA